MHVHKQLVKLSAGMKGSAMGCISIRCTIYMVGGLTLDVYWQCVSVL